MEDQGQGGSFCHLMAKTANGVFFPALGGKDEGFPDQERVEHVRSSGVCVYVDITACESLCAPAQNFLCTAGGVDAGVSGLAFLYVAVLIVICLTRIPEHLLSVKHLSRWL